MAPSSRNPIAASQASPPPSAGTNTAIAPPQARAAALRCGRGPMRSSPETSLPIHTTGCAALGSSRNAKSSAAANSSAAASRYHSPGHNRHSIQRIPAGRIIRAVILGLAQDDWAGATAVSSGLSSFD